ncbi:MAG TPA: class I SAM-dependent methyltransferase [Dehalococcoidia bacterium]|nr:class I SAM-dependent methyltransferase [Dehalococcoidia bacterium]
MKRYNDYDVFAWLYNRELGWYSSIIFPFLKIIAGDNLPDGARILDLCCGTGHLAKILCENDYHVTGIDGSAKMLQYARRNAPAAKFFLGDARSFKLSAEFDAVFSTFDSLNHVMTLTELERVFKNVYTCLNKGGIFIFDMNMQEHFETRMKEGINSIFEKPKYLYIMRTEYDEERKLGKYTVTIFQSEDKFWKRSDIVLYQTWYPLENIVFSLGKTGFTAIKTHAFTHQRELQEVNENSDRVFFYGQKP